MLTLCTFIRITDKINILFQFGLHWMLERLQSSAISSIATKNLIYIIEMINIRRGIRYRDILHLLYRGLKL